MILTVEKYLFATFFPFIFSLIPYSYFAGLVLKNIIRVSWIEVVPEEQRSTIVSLLISCLGDEKLLIQNTIVFTFHI